MCGTPNYIAPEILEGCSSSGATGGVGGGKDGGGGGGGHSFQVGRGIRDIGREGVCCRVGSVGRGGGEAGMDATDPPGR